MFLFLVLPSKTLSIGASKFEGPISTERQEVQACARAYFDKRQTALLFATGHHKILAGAYWDF